MSAPAKGVDVSTWNHADNEPIDWEAVAHAGYTFAIIKATQGDGYVNPWLRRDYDDAFAAGLLVGAYHFYDATAEATKQAEHFVGSLIGMKLDLHAWLDLEISGFSNWELAGFVNTFLEATKDGRPGTGLYCNLSTWNELQSAAVKVPALWAADWGVTQAPDMATIWQKGQGDVAGIPGQVDLDYIVSTRGLNLSTTPPPKPSVNTVRTVELPAEQEVEEEESKPTE
jgi:GH25 family lysozyme M1 (1,4-beta-N-acetylmuramidase)